MPAPFPSTLQGVPLAHLGKSQLANRQDSRVER